MDCKHEVILCVVNAGFSEAVMDAARKFGARGGTVIHGRGTASLEAEKRFNFSVQPEKEVVMIIVESTIRDEVLHGLYQEVGLKSAGQGIAFSLPVDDVVGLSVAKPVEEKPAESATEKKEEGQATVLETEEYVPARSFALEEAEVAMDKEKLLEKLNALKNGGDKK